MILDAIIPAFNEEQTVALVVTALLSSWVFRSVTVIDDGSTDRTGAAAALAGATVWCLPENLGKGQAMLYGHDITAGDAEGIAFFDADAVAFEPRHARQLAERFAEGYDQVCGIQDYGILNPLARRVSLLTGQRIVRRWVLDEIPRSCGRYTIEAAINHIVESRGGTTSIETLDGASFRSKRSKRGSVSGLLEDWRMLRDVRRAQRDLGEIGECRT